MRTPTRVKRDREALRREMYNHTFFCETCMAVEYSAGYCQEQYERHLRLNTLNEQYDENGRRTAIR